MGCFGSKNAVVDPGTNYKPDEAQKGHNKRASGVDNEGPERSDGHSHRGSNKNFKRSSTVTAPESEEAELKSKEEAAAAEKEPEEPAKDAAKEAAAKEAERKEKKETEKPKVQRRHSAVDATNQSDMWLSVEEVQPFAQVEVKWKLKGRKGNEADWIGMYEGVEVPSDIDNYVSSMMATGKDSGTVKFTAPNHPGLHHFRYFLLDDTEASVSPAFIITKLAKGDAEENIHVRDAISAENEVKRIEGKKIDSDEEEEGPGAEGVEGGEKTKKKKKKSVAREYDDMTGFEVDESDHAPPMERVVGEAQKAKDEQSEQVMHAATNYVKKIPTKKEMRAQASAKVAAVQSGHSASAAAPVNRSSTENPEGGDSGPKKKAGWGAVRSAVKVAGGGGGFQQGRANKGDDQFKNRSKMKKVGDKGGDEMGSFVINRGKK